jgi:lipid A 3-O-deacylase
MKRFYHFSALLLLLNLQTGDSSYAQTGDSLCAQQPANTEQEPTRLFRVYWDDDYFNYAGKGTDRAYTDGTRFELFYTKKKPSHFFIDRAMPKAGDSSIKLFGWGLVQLMLTPNNISQTNYQPNDYPWSGALFVAHTLYSYHERKKYDFQTEIDLGVTGPASLAAQTQDFVHHLIHYQRPMGWHNQFGNSPLLNISFTVEKQFAGYRHWIEAIGGGQAFTGTGYNGAEVYSLIRIGKMTPYFSGFLKQYSSSGPERKMQFYFVFKPQVQWILTSALFQGGLNSSAPNEMVVKDGDDVRERYHSLDHMVSSFSFGPVLVIGRFTISSTQTTSSAWMKGLYNNTYGNLSLYYTW